jgi:hypothetical protein
MKNSLALYSLQIENVNALLTESDASDLAHKLGLKHIGWGYYQNAEGLTVAKTIQGKLVKLNGQEFDTANHQAKKKDSAQADIEMGDIALKKAMNGLIDYAGLDIGENDPEYSALKRGLIHLAENPTNESSDIMDIVNGSIPHASHTQTKLAYKYLSHLADTPDSPIMTAMKGYKAAHAILNEPDENQPNEPNEPTSLSLKTAKEAVDKFFKDSPAFNHYEPLAFWKILGHFVPFIQTIKYLRDPSENYKSQLADIYKQNEFSDEETADVLDQLYASKKALWDENYAMGPQEGTTYGQYFNPNPFVIPYQPKGQASQASSTPKAPDALTQYISNPSQETIDWYNKLVNGEFSPDDDFGLLIPQWKALYKDLDDFLTSPSWDENKWQSLNSTLYATSLYSNQINKILQSAKDVWMDAHKEPDGGEPNTFPSTESINKAVTDIMLTLTKLGLVGNPKDPNIIKLVKNQLASGNDYYDDLETVFGDKVGVVYDAIENAKNNLFGAGPSAQKEPDIEAQVADVIVDLPFNWITLPSSQKLAIQNYITKKLTNPNDQWGQLLFDAGLSAPNIEAIVNATQKAILASTPEAPDESTLEPESGYNILLTNLDLGHYTSNQIKAASFGLEKGLQAATTADATEYFYKASDALNIMSSSVQSYLLKSFIEARKTLGKEWDEDEYKKTTGDIINAPESPSTPVTPQQSQEILDILTKIANAKYVQQIHNLKKKAFAAGVTEEQWKALLGYLKGHLAAFHINPYHTAKDKKKKSVEKFNPQDALKAMGMDQSQQAKESEPIDKQEKEFDKKTIETTAHSILADLGVSGLLPKGINAQWLLKGGTPIIMDMLTGPAWKLPSYLAAFGTKLTGAQLKPEFKDALMNAVNDARQKLQGEEPASDTPKLANLIPKDDDKEINKIIKQYSVHGLIDLLNSHAYKKGHSDEDDDVWAMTELSSAITSSDPDAIESHIKNAYNQLKFQSPAAYDALKSLVDKGKNHIEQHKIEKAKQSQIPIDVSSAASDHMINALIDNGIYMSELPSHTADDISASLHNALSAQSTEEAINQFMDVAKLLNLSPDEDVLDKLIDSLGEARKTLGKEWNDKVAQGFHKAKSSPPDQKYQTSIDADNLAQQSIGVFEKKWGAQFSDTTATMMQDAISKAIAAPDMDTVMEYIETAASLSTPGSLFGDKFDDILDYVQKARKQLKQEKPTSKDPAVADLMNAPETSNADDSILKYASELHPYSKLLKTLEDKGIDLHTLPPEAQGKVAKSLQDIDKLPLGNVNIPTLFKILTTNGVFIPTGDPQKSIAGQMAAELFKQKQAQLASGEIGGTEEPTLEPEPPATSSKQVLDKIDVPQPNVKAVTTAMNSAWSKGDPGKVAAWIYNKWKNTPAGQTLNRQTWENMMVALGKYFDYDLVQSQAAQAMLPDIIKSMLSAPAAPPEKPITPPSAPTSYFGTAFNQNDVDTAVNYYLNKAGGDANDAAASAHSILDATGDWTAKKEMFQMIVDKLQQQADAAQANLLQPTKEPEVDPEIEQQHKEESAAEAKDYLSNFLKTVGMDFKKLPQKSQEILQTATDKALSSQSEFGVIWAFHNLDNLIDDTILDNLKDTILDKLQKEGSLDTDPNAFKKHFDYEGFLNSFLTANPDFTSKISSNDKATLLQAMKVGLSMPTYADAKAYYNQTLVGKIPGFDENVFQKWRSQLMAMHDELKNAATYEKQKKAEKEAKKKEAEAMQKALEQLSKGDLKSKLDAIVTAAGLNTGNALDVTKIKLAVANALKASDSTGVLQNLPAISTNKSLVDNLVLSTFFDTKYNLTPKTLQPEPKVIEPLELRAKHAFTNWFKLAGGLTPGHVPSGERHSLIASVTNAIQMTDQKAMPGWLAASLASSTSLTDDQIVSLVKAVQQERTNPLSLQKGPKPSYVMPVYAPSTTPSTPASSTGKLLTDPAFTKYLKYYDISPTNKEAIAAIIDTLGSQHIYSGNRVTAISKLQSQLMKYGVSATTANHVAKWATREAMKSSDLAKKAYVQSSATTSVGATGGIPLGSNQQAIQNYVASMTNIQDPHGFVRGITAKGEIMVIEHSIKYNAPESDGGYSNPDAKQQKAWLEQNLSPELHAKWMKARSGWQGNSQWGKNWKDRKFTNQAVTQVIEGPPPLYAQMPPDKFVERGMSITATDFKEFIKAFEVGKKSFIGPSGFSANTQTPRGYAGHVGTSDYVSVLLRVRPDKTGKLKGARLQAYTFAGEHEIILGTGNNYRCAKVIKHLIPQGNKLVPAYEIELQYEDNTNESVIGIPTTNWQGMNRNTIKTLLKYMNSSIHQIPRPK